MMIGLMIFLIKFNTIDNHIQNTTQLDDVCLDGAIRNCARHVTVVSYNLLIATKYVT